MTSLRIRRLGMNLHDNEGWREHITEAYRFQYLGALEKELRAA